MFYNGGSIFQTKLLTFSNPPTKICVISVVGEKAPPSVCRIFLAALIKSEVTSSIRNIYAN